MLCYTHAIFVSILYHYIGLTPAEPVESHQVLRPVRQDAAEVALKETCRMVLMDPSHPYCSNTHTYICICIYIYMWGGPLGYISSVP